MAGIGPPPKDAAIRQRKNRKSTAADLPAVGSASFAHELYEKEGGWHRRTVAFWGRVWSSPMASKYVEADLDGLYVLAELMDQFFNEPCRELAAEIRLQRVAFGLTPIDRSRLQWKVEPAAPKPAVVAEPRPGADPRKVLEMRR